MQSKEFKEKYKEIILSNAELKSLAYDFNKRLDRYSKFTRSKTFKELLSEEEQKSVQARAYNLLFENEKYEKLWPAFSRVKEESEQQNQ